MEYAFSILMFCFSAGILLYAGMVAVFGVSLIRRHWAVKMKDEKAYAKGFAKVLSITALGPALGGGVALLTQSVLLVMLALILGTAAAIWFGVRIAGSDLEGGNNRE